MNWYYKILGDHTHVRVFMNGAKCGDLCFRNEEFNEIRSALDYPEDEMRHAPKVEVQRRGSVISDTVPLITFFNEGEP